jgi:PadR family transcriptional regulator PadR
MDIQLKKGILEICVLKCLGMDSSYGYKIVQTLENYVNISESTLYPILKRLEKNKCLETYTEEYNGRLRKYYKITDIGEQRISEFINEWEEINKVYKFIVEGRINDKK